MHRLAERVKVIGPTKIDQSLRIIEQDPSIISLGAGEPDFDVPKFVTNVAVEKLKSGFTHYSPLQGRHELREALVDKLKKENSIQTSKDEIIITNGSTEAILLSMLVLTDPGDEVIVTDPGFLAFLPMIKMISAVPVEMRLEQKNDFKIDVDFLKKHITKKTKMLVLNSPANPTGTVLHKKLLEEIADIVVENNIMVLSDEAYEKFVYEDEKHISFASLNGMFEYAITTQSFSKSYAMPGFRIGYGVAPADVVREMREFKVVTTISPSPAFQLAAVEALKRGEEHVEKMRKEYDRRRKMILKRLKEIEGFRVNHPKGAFYVFPNIEGVKMNSRSFVDFLLKEAKVICVPGTEFGKFGEGFVRMSYATSFEKIEEAMDRIEKSLKNI